MRDFVFSKVVLDEAAQMSEASANMVLSHTALLSSLVLIGDHKQLPPTVKSQKNVSDNSDRSLFERLLYGGIVGFVRLREQFRMHPSIASYPNEAFYQGQLVNASLSRALRGYPFPTSDPVAFVNIQGHEELHESSFRNLSEALAIIDVVKHLLGAGGLDSDAIGIVTPYSAQVALIGNELRSRSLRVGSLASVDKSQGSERDVILVSTVRSNNHGAIGHVKDARRLNVALTRARRAVILFGNERTLVERDECNVWNPFAF